MKPATPFTARDLLPPFLRPFTAPIDAALGLATLQRLYCDLGRERDFIAGALETLRIHVLTLNEDLAHVPRDGPLVVVANHPRGAADGLVVVSALRQVRPDIKLLGNELLARIPEMRNEVLHVDVFGLTRRGSFSALRNAIKWLKQGHVLVVFPAGSVSHATGEHRRLVDGPWQEGAARLAALAGAPVLPVFIDGRNSSSFVAAGKIHPLFRTGLLARELLRQRGSQTNVRIGRPVADRRLLSLGDASTRTAYLRMRCYALAPGATRPSRLLRVLRAPRIEAPLAPAAPADDLAAEIAGLPAAALVLESGPWAVFCAEADAIPIALQEIGRLRELTFRQVGEGTGRARDLDRYDAFYQHLFIWHREERTIAGAYRVAASDRIARVHGPHGLYTRSLFRYPAQLLDELGPSLELGRSFVQPAFQRDYQPLLLLWRGIGRLIASEPRYRRLFGPVSISASYGAITRQILARFLMANRYCRDLGKLVTAKRPLRNSSHEPTELLVRSTVVSRLERVEELVRELESDQRGMPVLLRQYLKLNAKLLGFSVDPSFGNVLDGLVVVDLLDVDGALLTRYLGKDGAARFLAHHQQSPVGPSPRQVVAHPATA